VTHHRTASPSRGPFLLARLLGSWSATSLRLHGDLARPIEPRRAGLAQRSGEPEEIVDHQGGGDADLDFRSLGPYTRADLDPIAAESDAF
jgi:hypothetical protein